VNLVSISDAFGQSGIEKHTKGTQDQMINNRLINA